MSEEILIETKNGSLSRNAKKVINVACEIIKNDYSIPKDKRKLATAGYLTIAYASGRVISIESIEPTGDFANMERADACLVFSQEKARRLSEKTDLTSFESRDPANKKYGGAIKVGGDKKFKIISFSGLPELWDEASMFMTAILSIEDDEARRLFTKKALDIYYGRNEKIQKDSGLVEFTTLLSHFSSHS